MKDIQNDPADVRLHIDRVGVKNLQLPLVVRDRERGRQHTVAEVDLFVDLPSRFKGTHMSRFVETLGNWDEGLDPTSFRTLLEDVRTRLEARHAHIHFRFPFFVRQTSPASGAPGLMGYDCSLVGELRENELSFVLGVDVPVMSVCPCSLAICDGPAHSQRSMVRIRTRFKGFLWIEDLIEIAEGAGSSPVYTLLKREDERAVTQAAFEHPAFVEDVVRSAAKALEDHPQVTWYRVEVESMESIHKHNAYASIEKACE